jgi:hypothetical protein
MTQPKFPWVLLAIIAMFTFLAVSPVSPPWIVVLAIIAILLSAAAAVYQVVPRKDPSIAPAADPEAVPDQWSDEQPS